MSHSQYRQAYTTAWQRARDLAHEYHLPESAINEYRRTEKRAMTIVIETP